MTIKHQQLLHSLQHLDELMKELNSEQRPFTKHMFRDQVTGMFESVQDCLDIIYSILSDTKK